MYTYSLGPMILAHTRWALLPESPESSEYATRIHKYRIRAPPFANRTERPSLGPSEMAITSKVPFGVSCLLTGRLLASKQRETLAFAGQTLLKNNKKRSKSNSNCIYKKNA